MEGSEKGMGKSKVIFFVTCFLLAAVISTYLINQNIVSETFLELLLDYIKVLIWPFTILFLGAIFKPQIANILDDLSEWSSLFGKFTRRPLPPLKTPDDKITPEQQEDIKKTVETKEGEHADPSLAPKLANQIATLQTALLFERIYNGIYNTQLSILDWLRSNPDGLWYKALDTVYQNWRSKEKMLEKYPLGDYIGYLENLNLIIPVEVEGGRKYRITDRGIEFLDYIEKSKYPIMKFHPMSL